MVGILTFHKAINYGAVLQAYALRNAVESLGQACSVINYAGQKMYKESKTFYFPHHSSMTDRLLYLYRLPMRARTVGKFNAFLEEYLNLSGAHIGSGQELQKVAEKCDYLITGSDQVFNYTGTGEDFNFYLEFEKDSCKKVAYAPSFGLKEVDEDHRKRVTENLQSFRALSVREEAGADIVEKLTGTRPQMVCDPTFLLAKEKWEQLCIKPKHKKPYVLIYSFGSRHLEGAASKLAAQIGADVVNINRALPVIGCKGIKNAYAPGPREFLGLIQNAQAVVTNSFHGMALSILLEKEFYVYKNQYANSEATNSRFDTLAGHLGLSNRVLNMGTQIERSPIDYTAVTEKVEQWRAEGIAFLKDALSGDGK